MTKKRILFWIFGLFWVAAAVLGMVIVTTCEVKSVEIRGNTRYSDEEVKEMVLTGPFSRYSVLAPLLCTKESVSNVYFVDGWTVTRTGKDSLVITINEKKPVGCISYLDNYIYFDKNGCFVDASMSRDELVPYFNGIKVTQVVENEKIPIKGTTVLDTAVSLTNVFQKEDTLPDYAEFDTRGEVSLSYDDIKVSLGSNEYMEDKMARVLAILPQLEGKKGILHLESISEKSKTVTFEPSVDSPEDPSKEEWQGGYDADGTYTGEGEYTVNGKYVGPKPLSDLENAIACWIGGYDEEGDLTGTGPYDAYGNYVGDPPDEVSFAALGTWKGGYTEDGKFNWTGEFDRDGNYTGPNTEENVRDGALAGYFSEEDEDDPEEESYEEDEGEGSYAEEDYGGTDYDSGDEYDTSEDPDDQSYDDYDDYDYNDDYDEYDDQDDSYDDYTDDGGIYDEAYYDQLYEGIYW